MTEANESKLAPHGRDENGDPIIKFGVNLDGTPRKSNRGARPGQKQGSTSKARTKTSPTTTSATDKQRKTALLSLAEMFVLIPLAGASVAPPVIKAIGPVHADALAGNALILKHYSEPLADSLIVLSQAKPGMLAWLDTLEEKAPYLMLLKVGAEITKALVSNHMNPNPQLNEAGRQMATMSVMKMAAEIQQEADEMGLSMPAPEYQDA